MTDTIEQSWSKADVCSAWKLSPRRIDQLVRSGAIGYIKSGHGKRFLAKHVGQILAAIEVEAAVVTDDDLRLIGVTPGSAARRRRMAGQA